MKGILIVYDTYYLMLIKVFFFFLVFVGIIILAYIIFKKVRNSRLKQEIFEKYGILIHRGFKIKRNNSGIDGEYFLKYPKWLYSNKNGSANRVRKGNRLVYYPSTLYFKDYIISINYPDEMISLVRNIRYELGANSIHKNQEELIKYSDQQKKIELYNNTNNIQKIINEFRENPTEFEEFCATLYREKGYDVEVTPKVNDGGYDLILHKDLEKSIAECKCYALRHTRGRPLIQKLVGANQQAQADRMIFITTSSFSDEAIDYAKDVNVELIDGKKLLKMINTSDNSSKKTRMKIEDWELTIEDIRKFYPPDITI